MASSKIPKINSKEEFDRIIGQGFMVVADFYTDWCEPHKQIEGNLENIAATLSALGSTRFVKIDTDSNRDLATKYEINALPTFVIFSKKGEVLRKVSGTDPSEILTTLSELGVANSEPSAPQEAGPSGQPWKGAGIPKGYRDFTDQVETKGCELLNADEDAGPVRVLFGEGAPSGKATADSADWVQSGSDDQLLLYVPFQSTVKLHTLQLTSVIPSGVEDAPSRPVTVRLYINRTSNIDFDEADETEPTQELELGPSDWNSDNTANIPLRYVRFQKTTTLIIYVQKGDGEAETVRLDRIRFIGEAGPTREMGKLQKVGEDE